MTKPPVWVSFLLLREIERYEAPLPPRREVGWGGSILVQTGRPVRGRKGGREPGVEDVCVCVKPEIQVSSQRAEHSAGMHS